MTFLNSKLEEKNKGQKKEENQIKPNMKRRPRKMQLQFQYASTLRKYGINKLKSN